MTTPPTCRVMQGESKGDMTQKDVLRYLYLVDRRLTILISGINWNPEYGRELKNLEKELSELRNLVDNEHRKREQAAG